MGNKRPEIRDALKTLLINASTAAGNNVFTNRENGQWKAELPLIIIHTSQEAARPESLKGRRYIRTLELTVTTKIKATDSTDDELDDFVAAVEDEIVSNPSLSGTVLSTILTSTQIIIDSESEYDIGVGILTYECQYIN